MERKDFEALPVGTFVRNLAYGLQSKIVEIDGQRMLQFPPYDDRAATASVQSWSDETIAAATVDLPFQVRILWGQIREPDQKATTYAFDTQAELDAFLYGVEQASGWLDYETVERLPDGTYVDAMWQAQLKPGDTVKWNDPDAGACSGILTVRTIDIQLDSQCVRIETADGRTLGAGFDELEQVSA